MSEKSENRPETVAVIVAVAENAVIGKDNKLPWHLPRDLKFFKSTTLGYPIISGRRTHESHGQLPKRRNIVLSRQPDYHAAGAEKVHSLDHALALAGDAEKVFILGGESVFHEAIAGGYADTLILTRVHAHYDGDTFFPGFDENQWTRVWHEYHPADERNETAMTFERWVRKNP